MVCHWPAKTGPKNSTEHQTCANKTNHVGLEVKLGHHERHRYAKDENSEAIKQCASGREHPEPSLNRLQRRFIQQQRQAFRWCDLNQC